MALAELFLTENNSYVMRATARLYLTAGGALVTENDPAGRIFWRDIGGEISLADAHTYGLLPRSFNLPAKDLINVAIVSVGVGDSTGDITLTIPGGSLILEALAICIEPVTGATTRPSIDWGMVGGDADGIFDGLGESGICDTIHTVLGSKSEDLGLGALMTSPVNEDDIKIRVTRFSMSEQVFQNTQTSAGAGTTITGAWMIVMIYITMPSFLGMGA